MNRLLLLTALLLVLPVAPTANAQSSPDLAILSGSTQATTEQIPFSTLITSSAGSTVSSSNLPATATLTEQASGRSLFEWTPNFDEAGEYAIEFTDGTNTSSLNLTVHDNHQVAIPGRIPAPELAPGELFEYTIRGVKADLEPSEIAWRTVQNHNPGGEVFNCCVNGEATIQLGSERTGSWHYSFQSEPGVKPYTMSVRIGNKISPIQSGNWSDPATWGGSIPNNDSLVRITGGHTVTINSTNAQAIDVEISEGSTLRFNPEVNTKLSLRGSLAVLGDGLLEMGTVENPIAPTVSAEIGFYVIYDPLTTIGSPVVDPSAPLATISNKAAQPGPLAEYPHYQPGDIGLWVVGPNARAILHGSPVTQPWTTLATDATAGSTSLVVTDDVSTWQTGDSVAIAGTNTGSTHHTTSIGSVSGNNLSLADPVSNLHEGSRYAYNPTDNTTRFLNPGDSLNPDEKLMSLQAEIANLSRNVIIRSTREDVVSTGQARAHISFSNGATGSVNYASLEGLGPQYRKDRHGVSVYNLEHTAPVSVVGNVFVAGTQQPGARAISSVNSAGTVMASNIAVDQAGYVFHADNQPNLPGAQVTNNLTLGHTCCDAEPYQTTPRIVDGSYFDYFNLLAANAFVGPHTVDRLHAASATSAAGILVGEGTTASNLVAHSNGGGGIMLKNATAASSSSWHNDDPGLLTTGTAPITVENFMSIANRLAAVSPLNAAPVTITNATLVGSLEPKNGRTVPERGAALASHGPESYLTLEGSVSANHTATSSNSSGYHVLSNNTIHDIESVALSLTPWQALFAPSASVAITPVTHLITPEIDQFFTPVSFPTWEGSAPPAGGRLFGETTPVAGNNLTALSHGIPVRTHRTSIEPSLYPDRGELGENTGYPTHLLPGAYSLLLHAWNKIPVFDHDNLLGRSDHTIPETTLSDSPVSVISNYQSQPSTDITLHGEEFQNPLLYILQNDELVGFYALHSRFLHLSPDDYTLFLTDPSSPYTPLSHDALAGDGRADLRPDTGTPWNPLTDRGVLEGIVFDADGETPLPNATLQLFVGTERRQVTLTDSLGRYRFAGLSADQDYQIRARNKDTDLTINVTPPPIPSNDTAAFDFVLSTNQPPDITLNPPDTEHAVKVGDDISIQATATDEDSTEPPTLNLTPLPSGATFE